MNPPTGAARSGNQMQSPRNSVFSNPKTGGLFRAAVQARLGGELDTGKAHAKLLERLAALPAAIVSSAKRVQELLHQVTMGAHRQTTSVAHTAQAVQELDKVTQQNSALVEQTAAAAAMLNGRAVHLAGEVAQFRLPAD